MKSTASTVLSRSVYTIADSICARSHRSWLLPALHVPSGTLSAPDCKVDVTVLCVQALILRLPASLAQCCTWHLRSPVPPALASRGQRSSRMKQK